MEASNKLSPPINPLLFVLRFPGFILMFIGFVMIALEFIFIMSIEFRAESLWDILDGIGMNYNGGLWSFIWWFLPIILLLAGEIILYIANKEKERRRIFLIVILFSIVIWLLFGIARSQQLILT